MPLGSPPPGVQMDSETPASIIETLLRPCTAVLLPSLLPFSNLWYHCSAWKQFRNHGVIPTATGTNHDIPSPGSSLTGCKGRPSPSCAMIITFTPCILFAPDRWRPSRGRSSQPVVPAARLKRRSEHNGPEGSEGHGPLSRLHGSYGVQSRVVCEAYPWMDAVVWRVSQTTCLVDTRLRRESIVSPV